MKELVVISGKGGTGKTSLTAAFAALTNDAVLADCDVDAADLHLLLRPEIREREDFRCGHKAVICEDQCVSCGQCQTICRFEAIKKDETGKFMVDPLACEGCGVCVYFCRTQAIDFPEQVCGETFISETHCGPMVHARLNPGAENSGKLVSMVRKTARELAEKRRKSLLLTDGPPGIGCPVIASVTGATTVLVITEPTVSGEHDLDRVLKLTKHFQIPTLVCVNKWNINPEVTQRIQVATMVANAKVVGRIPYDSVFTAALVRGRSVSEYPESDAAKIVKKTWEQICQMM